MLTAREAEKRRIIGVLRDRSPITGHQLAVALVKPVYELTTEQRAALWDLIASGDVILTNKRELALRREGD